MSAEMTGIEFTELRLFAGYSQTGLVQIIHKSLRSISRYETGRAPIPPLVADAMRNLKRRKANK
jgi:transcriptional regulator with XRE-family HTH domain